jgi:type II secretory pathway pseudopilin PulG
VGFSLLELLIVIGIILVLMAMIFPAFSRVMDRVSQARTRTEISQLDTAVANAKRALSLSGVDLPYLPSSIVLCDNWSDYSVSSIPVTTPPWDARITLANLASSKAFLQKVFGKNIGLGSSGTLTLDWNGNGVADHPVYLTGEQALVFWLGGRPLLSGTSPGGCTGFASNPSDPTMAAGTSGSGDRKGPFFDFKIGQLVLGSNGFYAYQDPYLNGAVYVYYSSDGNGNYSTSTADIPAGVGAGGTGGPYPYQIPSGLFVNPRTHQIISAGKNGVFGNTTAGSFWDPTIGWISGPGADDLANFSPNLLGRPQS